MNADLTMVQNISHKLIEDEDAYNTAKNSRLAFIMQAKDDPSTIDIGEETTPQFQLGASPEKINQPQVVVTSPPILH